MPEPTVNPPSGLWNAMRAEDDQYGDDPDETVVRAILAWERSSNSMARW